MDGMPSLVKNLVKSQTALKANMHFTSLYMTAGPRFAYPLVPRMAIRQPWERCLLNLVQRSQSSFLCCVFPGLSKKTWSFVMEQLCVRTSLVLTNHPPHVGLSFRWVLDSAMAHSAFLERAGPACAHTGVGQSQLFSLHSWKWRNKECSLFSIIVLFFFLRIALNLFVVWRVALFK